MKTKRTIKLMILSLTITGCFMITNHASAQNWGSSTGTEYDLWIINDDNSNDVSRLRLQTSTNRGWNIVNQGTGGDYGSLWWGYNAGSNHGLVGDEKMRLFNNGNLRIKGSHFNLGSTEYIYDAGTDMVGIGTNLYVPGKVGIGINNPEKLFEVNTGLAVWDDAIVRIKGAHNPTLDIHSTNNWHPRLRLLTNDGADAWEMHAAGSWGSRSLIFAYNGTNLFGISKTGKVGIGDMNPSTTLHVSGTGYFSDDVGIGTTNPLGKLHINGDTYAKGHVYLYAYEGNNTSGTAYLQARDKSGTSSIGLQLRSQNEGSYVDALKIQPDGNVGIGTTNPAEKLDVAGTVKATSFVSSAASFPDYVFAENYKIMPLQELETYVTTHKHLPDMPSEKEVVEQGLNVPEVLTTSVENIETIYLHLIRMEKEIKALQQENAVLKQALKNER